MLPARLVAVAVAAPLVLVPASAHAGPSWLRAQTVSRLGPAPFIAPEVALLPSGDGVAAWARARPGRGDYGSLLAAVRPRGSRFSAPAQLSQPGRFVGSFDLAGSSAGETVVAWTDAAGDSGDVPGQAHAA